MDDLHIRRGSEKVINDMKDTGVRVVFVLLR